MSPVNKLSVLAFASTVLAVPHVGFGHGHAHGHQHLHERHLTGTAAPFPYPSANGTSAWGTTGTGASGPSSSQALPETATENTIQTQTVFQTVSVNQAYPSSAAGGEGEGEQCGVSTVTSTEKVYVTVTGGEAASSSADVSPVGSSSGRPTSTLHITQTYQAPGGYGSSSSEAAAASSSAQGSSAPAYSAPASSSSEASPETTSEASAPAYSAPASSAPASSSSTEQAPVSVSISTPVPKDSAPASSSSAAAIPTAYSSVADKGAEGAAATASATSSAPASSSSSASSGSGKRGLAYNDASLLDCFSGSDKISWAYNWESSAKGLSGFTYIPTLWGTSPTYCDSWSENAKSAISSGSTHLFSFNEPDISSQANLSPSDAAAGYKTHMNPFAGQAKLCAPAVTNGPASENMGLSWLKQFLSACSDCTIDCLNIHWYDSATNTDYFKQHVTDAISLANGKPVYISEIGATGSNDQINSFLEEVMPWMDSNDGVAGYAYYMASEGLLVSGSEPSTYGSTYKTYSS